MSCTMCCLWKFKFVLIMNTVTSIILEKKMYSVSQTLLGVYILDYSLQISSLDDNAIHTNIPNFHHQLLVLWWCLTTTWYMYLMHQADGKVIVDLLFLLNANSIIMLHLFQLHWHPRRQNSWLTYTLNWQRKINIR